MLHRLASLLLPCAIMTGADALPVLPPIDGQPPPGAVVATPPPAMVIQPQPAKPRIAFRDEVRARCGSEVTFTVCYEEGSTITLPDLPKGVVYHEKYIIAVSLLDDGTVVYTVNLRFIAHEAGPHEIVVHVKRPDGHAGNVGFRLDAEEAPKGTKDDPIPNELVDSGG